VFSTLPKPKSQRTDYPAYEGTTGDFPDSVRIHPGLSKERWQQTQNNGCRRSREQNLKVEELVYCPMSNLAVAYGCDNTRETGDANCDFDNSRQKGCSVHSYPLNT
jgi:hypothetical protein